MAGKANECQEAVENFSTNFLSFSTQNIVWKIADILKDALFYENFFHF